MNEPTKAQEQEFWGRCGFAGMTIKIAENVRDVPYNQISTVQYPDGTTYPDYPPIDLNSLFLYAVPKVKEKLEEPELAQLLFRWVEKIIAGKDPALALYWIILEVFNDRQIKIERVCPRCNGARVCVNYLQEMRDCPTCNGTGKQTIEFTIKEAIEEKLK